jgi:hypothetical protein
MADREDGGGAAPAAVGGGGAAKRARPEDPEILTRLRKEASEQHGAPAALPDECLRSWIKFATGRPEVVVTDRGIFLKSQGHSEESNYASYFSPVYVDGYYKLKCRLFGCGSVISFFATKDKRLQGVFTNAKRHLLACPGRPLLCSAGASSLWKPFGGRPQGAL